MELSRGRQRFIRRLFLLHLLSIYLVSSSLLRATIGSETPCSDTRSSSHARIHCLSQGSVEPDHGQGGGAGGGEEEAGPAGWRQWLSGPGSWPPRCKSKCGKCTPCKPVHVPVPPGTPVTTEYYPEAWRCKCGNKLYMP